MKRLSALILTMFSIIAAMADDSSRVVAYVTSWSDVMPDPRLMTNINYAFGHVSDSFDGVRIDNPQRLRKIADLKRLYPDLQVQLSIGGWGSGRFSEMAADPVYRKSFARDCRRVMDEYGLDGIDIDWEYPTSDAAGISASPADTRNFTLLMRDLREALPEGSLLTLASVADAGYIDFKSIMPYVDFVNIMAYDMARPPYHHSPLHSSPACGEASAETAVAAHLAAGVPARKLTLGIPLYGRGKAPYNDFVDFRDIDLKPGCRVVVDSIAKAPYIADAGGRLVLGYDDEASVRLKCRFIKEQGLLGAMYWDYAGDNGRRLLTTTVADEMLHAGYAGDYAVAPRFNVLIYYSDAAEEAHVQFARQAIDFFHRLSYGEGFTYEVTTSLEKYAARLHDFDLMIDINAMPGSDAERDAFRRYMDAGGGWIGFHAAAYNDERTGWQWFNEFLGAGTFSCNTWPPQPALLEVNAAATHPVTRNLPSEFVAPECEWYQWNMPPSERGNVEVLLSLSQKNYPIGIKDIVSFGDFPIVWSNTDYRMIYLNIGHGDREFTDATQNLLLVNAFRWIASRRPSGNPFNPQVKDK